MRALQYHKPACKPAKAYTWNNFLRFNMHVRVHKSVINQTEWVNLLLSGTQKQSTVHDVLCTFSSSLIEKVRSSLVGFDLFLFSSMYLPQR